MDDHLTLYDLLDLRLDATPQEIRDAYLRTKATYSEQNLALYTLLSPEDREETLKKIEEAYFTLSDPDKRRNYDKSSNLQKLDSPFSLSTPVRPAHIIPFDRSTFAYASSANEQLLIPPKTDFKLDERETRSTPQRRHTDPPPALAPETFKTTPPPAKQRENPIKDLPMSSSTKISKHSNTSLIQTQTPELLREIEAQTEWKGAFLKHIREAYQISLEEMSAATKVTKTYLIAIEEENFVKLPASVYVRGFVVQIAKVLRLPHDQVAMTYLTRLALSRKV